MNTMLVTFHAILYVIAELSRPAWQKDLRDITYHIIEAMKEEKKSAIGSISWLKYFFTLL